MTNRPPKRFYEFDSFRIDIEERQLLRAGTQVPLTPKVFDCLLVLVENNGRTIEKEYLMDRVWADTAVEEGSLNRNISTLRKVLGENSHEPRFITTVPKRGYRFDWEVKEVLEEDEELVVEKRTKYRLTVSERTQADVRGETKLRFLSARSLAVAIAILAILTLGLGWAVGRIQKGEANSLAGTYDRTASGTKNAEAFELYRNARAMWQNRSVDGLHRATSDLERAVETDPNFALAHAALADAYAFDVKNWPKAEVAANEAIRLDPSLGQPHATIGFIRTFWEWKLRDAENHFKKAVALSPDYATAHQWYSINLAVMGRGGEALAEMKRALELEPDSVAINADLCQVFYFTRKYDLAIEQCQRTLQMDADYLNAHSYLYDIYLAKEMYPEAVAAYFRAEELHMTTLARPAQIRALKNAYAKGGIRAFLRQRVEMLAGPEKKGGYMAAKHYLLLGEREEAAISLRRAYENRDFNFVYLVADPTNADLLTSDPGANEFAQILLQ